MGIRERRQHWRPQGEACRNFRSLLEDQCALHSFQGGVLLRRYNMEDSGDTGTSSHSPVKSLLVPAAWTAAGMGCAHVAGASQSHGGVTATLPSA